MTERSRDYRRDAPIPSAAQGSSGGGPLLATVPPSLGRRESATGAKDYGREAWDNRPPSLRISGGVSAAWGDAREREWDREWDRDRSRDRSGDRSGDRSRDRNRERDRDRGRGNRGRGSTSPLTRGSSPLSIAAAAASLDAHAHTGGRFDGGGDGDIGSTRVSTGAFRYDHEHDVEASEVPPPPPTRRAVSAGGGDTHPPAYTQQRRFSSSGYAPVHRRDNNSGASGRSTETAKGVSGVVRGGISGAEVPEANRSGFDGRAAVAGRSVSSGPTLRVTNPDAFKGVDADGESGGGADELAGRVGAESDVERRRYSGGARGSGLGSGVRDRGRYSREHASSASRRDATEEESSGSSSTSSALALSGATARPRNMPRRLSGLAAIIAARSEDSPVKAVRVRVRPFIFF